MQNALMIEWGMPIAGRELKALEIYAATMQFWQKCAADGRIENFVPYGCTTGNIEKRSGLIMIHGSHAQIDELRHAEDFRESLNGILTIAAGVNVSVLETGNDMTTRMERYAKSIKKLG